MTTTNRAPRTGVGKATKEAESGGGVAMETKVEATVTGAGIEGIIETPAITAITAAMGVATMTAGTGAPDNTVGTDVQGRGTETIRAKHRPQGGAK